MMLSDVCLSVAYIVNIHGAHIYWKLGALGAAGVRRVWAGAGPHRAQDRGHIARLPAQLVSFCCQTSLMTATDCCQMEQQIQRLRDAWCSVHTAGVAPTMPARELSAND